MKNKITGNTDSPVLVGILSLLFVFILYQLAGGILHLILIGPESGPEDKYSLWLLSVGSQLLFILLPSILLTKAFYPDHSLQILRIKKPKALELVLYSLGLIFLIINIQSFVQIQTSILNSLVERYPFFESLKESLDSVDEMVQGSYEQLLSVNSAAEMIIVFLVVSVIPAVCEESFFRGFAQHSMELNIKPFFAALITSLFFGIYHFNPYGLIALIALGLYFGYSAYNSGSIAVPILLHFLNNFMMTLTYFVFGEESFEGTAVSEAPGDIWINLGVFVITGLVIVQLIYLINKYTNNNKEPESI